jgi:bifunctional DNA-binding transcriptional regulator/antitoxin component of YhaV-PrlF toxin-antitoxin module
MATLTVTSKGQVTLRKELLQHLGVEPGDKLEIDVLPNRRLSLRVPRKKNRTWDEISGILAGITDKVATIEEINEAAAEGWAGRVR